MRIGASTACGVIAGVNLFLLLAVIAVIAANGANNPGVARSAPSAAAGSSAPEPLPDGSFKGLDLDGDGRISLAEAAGHAEIVVRFDRADRNRDGSLTQAEFDRLSKMPPPKAPATGVLPRQQIRRDAATAAAGG